jgi:hypothetical protein
MAKGKAWILSALLAVAGAGPAEKLFVSPEGRFAVRFPSVPAATKHTLNTPAGPVALLGFTVTDKAKSMGYAVLYSDIPLKPGQAVDPDRMLGAGVFALADRPENRLVEDRLISLDGNPGREVVVEQSEQVLVKARIYVVGQRLYQVIVIAPKAKGFPPEAAAFLDSFRLLRD